MIILFVIIPFLSSNIVLNNTNPSPLEGLAHSQLLAPTRTIDTHQRVDFPHNVSAKLEESVPSHLGVGKLVRTVLALAITFIAIEFFSPSWISKLISTVISFFYGSGQVYVNNTYWLAFLGIVSISSLSSLASKIILYWEGLHKKHLLALIDLFCFFVTFPVVIDALRIRGSLQDLVVSLLITTAIGLFFTWTTYQTLKQARKVNNWLLGRDQTLNIENLDDITLLLYVCEREDSWNQSQVEDAIYEIYNIVDPNDSQRKIVIKLISTLRKTKKEKVFRVILRVLARLAKERELRPKERDHVLLTLKKVKEKIRRNNWSRDTEGEYILAEYLVSQPPLIKISIQATVQVAEDAINVVEKAAQAYPEDPSSFLIGFMKNLNQVDGEDKFRMTLEFLVSFGRVNWPRSYNPSLETSLFSDAILKIQLKEWDEDTLLELIRAISYFVEDDPVLVGTLIETAVNSKSKKVQRSIANCIFQIIPAPLDEKYAAYYASLIKKPDIDKELQEELLSIIDGALYTNLLDEIIFYSDQTNIPNPVKWKFIENSRTRFLTGPVCQFLLTGDLIDQIASAKEFQSVRKAVLAVLQKTKNEVTRQKAALFIERLGGETLPSHLKDPVSSPLAVGIAL